MELVPAQESDEVCCNSGVNTEKHTGKFVRLFPLPPPIPSGALNGWGGGGGENLFQH